MFKGATGKRLFYFFSASFRFISFLGLMIAYVIVRIVNEPQVRWLNALLLTLSLLSLLTALFNLVLCGMPATAYRQKFWLQLVCFVVTLVTGGVGSSAFTGIATFLKVEDEEIENERIINIKTFKREGQKDDKTTKKS